MGCTFVVVFSYVFSFTLFTVVLDSSSAYGEAVCIFRAPKQFSSDALSSLLICMRPRWQHQLLVFCKDLD